MTQTADVVWLALNVSMSSFADTTVEEYVAIPRAEWDAMTEDEREIRLQDEIRDFVDNNVDAGGDVVPADEVPERYRR